MKLPTNTDRLKLKELKRNVDVAKLYKIPTCSSTKMKKTTSRSTSSTPQKCKQTPSKHTNKYLQEKLDEANEKIKRIIAENKASQIKIHYLKLSPETKNKYNAELQQSILFIRKSKYSYENLKLKPAIFEYLDEISVEKFDILYNIFSIYAYD